MYVGSMLSTVFPGDLNVIFWLIELASVLIDLFAVLIFEWDDGMSNRLSTTIQTAVMICQKKRIGFSKLVS